MSVGEASAFVALFCVCLLLGRMGLPVWAFALMLLVAYWFARHFA